MKFFKNIGVRIVSALLCVIMLLPMLVSCEGAGLIKLKKSEDGYLVDKKNGITYVSCPSYIEPMTTTDPYAYYKKSKMTLYEIEGLDPKEWISESYAGIGIVFHANTIETPTLETFAPAELFICVSEEITYGTAHVTDKAVIDAVIDRFMNGTPVEWPLLDSIAIYDLKFTSETYPGLYYNLIWGLFEEGAFIYDRSTKHCVAADGLLDDYIHP